MQWNVVLFIIKVYHVYYLPYAVALYLMWHQYSADILVQLDNDRNYLLLFTAHAILALQALY